MTTDGKKINKYLNRLKRGDRCFDELMKCSMGYVGYVVYKNLVDKSFFGDAVSETYRNVVRYICTLDTSGNPLGWLCKIAQNEAYKINKREQKREEVGIEDVRDNCITHDTTERVLEAVDLYRALDRLDETDRRVIEYIFFEDKSHKEISEELHISIGDVAYRKKSALKKLLNFMSD
ncbi:MAG: sigma-70 family RNA polymerase sigma factor [Clostridiales bacterium]|nr:sigma-70 family RNA polymerase sigma factor [Clostridiales bacterium]